MCNQEFFRPMQHIPRSKASCGPTLRPRNFLDSIYDIATPWLIRGCGPGLLQRNRSLSEIYDTLSEPSWRVTQMILWGVCQWEGNDGRYLERK